MYTRQQGASTAGVAYSQEKNAHHEENTQKSTRNETEQAPENDFKNSQTSAPATEKKPKYRAVRRQGGFSFPKEPPSPSVTENQGAEDIGAPSPHAPRDAENHRENFKKDTDAPVFACFDREKPSPKTEQPCGERASKKGLFSSVLDTLDTDQILLLALTVLLVMQGSDDILVLALCFILL